MRIKLEELRAAIERLRQGSGYDDSVVVELTVRSEDIDSDKLCDCITIANTMNKKQPSYSNWDAGADIACTSCVEVFAESENRPPRWTLQESHSLIPKGKS